MIKKALTCIGIKTKNKQLEFCNSLKGISEGAMGIGGRKRKKRGQEEDGRRKRERRRREGVEMRRKWR